MSQQCCDIAAVGAQLSSSDSQTLAARRMQLQVPRICRRCRGSVGTRQGVGALWRLQDGTYAACCWQQSPRSCRTRGNADRGSVNRVSLLLLCRKQYSTCISQLYGRRTQGRSQQRESGPKQRASRVQVRPSANTHHCMLERAGSGMQRQFADSSMIAWLTAGGRGQCTAYGRRHQAGATSPIAQAS